MKVALIADLHLGSKAIGDGRWKQQAVERFIVPRLRELGVTHMIFPGDTLDFNQGRLSISEREQPYLVDFVAKQFSSVTSNGYLLAGNHDDLRSCGYLGCMPGAPKLVQDDWVDLGGQVGAFLMRGRQDKQSAIAALQSLDGTGFKRRVLVLHENLDVFHDQGFLAAAQAKFDLVVNGHNHVFRPVRENVYLLPACLPWQPRRGSQCDIQVKRSMEGEITRADATPWGFVVFGDDLVPHFVALDVGLRIAICEVETTEENVLQAIEETLDHLADCGAEEAGALAVRVYVSARLNPELRESVKQAYKSRFFADVEIQQWQGSGVLSQRLRERLSTEETALERVRTEHGEKARRMVEELAGFFHLKRPSNRKDEILTIICETIDVGEANGASDPPQPGCQSNP